MSTIKTSPFSYDFIPGVSQYSAGAMASPGSEIVRVRMAETPALPEAFKRIETYLTERNLEPTAVCAFEMRSPGQFNEDTFRTFNEAYIGKLEAWGILVDGENPVARANVIPATSSLTEPGIHAFSYVRPTEETQFGDTFVIAGSGEAPEGKGNYRDNIIALDDTSPAGFAKKTDWVIGEMARRLGAFGRGWGDVTNVQVYTTLPYEDAHAQLAKQVPTYADIAWQYCSPPVEGLVFEMDCRRVRAEEVLR
ncbi:2-amino-5-chloromuconate deaminase CnbZ [Ornithinimicrobium faecis]|uniref:2-amino-5-chloromuconate deaminase CnbZ n=1 Tax=Ornithinimicrobium faecis TaxID=2934158 RepID=UPI0021172E1C|nr:hypothetical protein [Ornithinimicrobium sp. HY1793]